MPTLLRAGLVLEALLAAGLAVYEGRAWAHRQSTVPWYTMFRPDALFRGQYFTEAGNRLRRIALRCLAALIVLGILLLLYDRFMSAA